MDYLFCVATIRVSLPASLFVTNLLRDAISSLITDQWCHKLTKPQHHNYTLRSLKTAGAKNDERSDARVKLA